MSLRHAARRARTHLMCAALLAAGLAMPSQAFAQSGPYTYTVLKYPGSTYTEADGINNTGAIVGMYLDSFSAPHGFVYEGGTYTTVDVPGAAATYAFEIDDFGRIVGTWAPTQIGPWHAFILDGGVFTTFDYPGMETDARALNASGQIVGVYNAGGTTLPHGFLKTGNTFTPIDVPGSQYTQANGITDAGLITGAYADANGTHGFLLMNGAFSFFNYPGASLTQLARINHSNQLVGWQFQAGRTRSFLWSGLSFRTFEPDTSTNAYALQINDLGVVVGQYFGTNCPSGCGFMATPATNTASCDQKVTASYASGTLTLGFTITSPTPATWAASLTVQGASVPLWSLAIPAVSSAPVSVPVPNFPHVGSVSLVSVLSTATNGVVCTDLAIVDTGK